MNQQHHGHAPGIGVWLIILSLIISACAGNRLSSPVAPATGVLSRPGAVISEESWPTWTWRTSTPEEQGMDARLLEEMLAQVDQEKINLHSLLVIRHGNLVSETYFSDYNQNKLHDQWSVTKSVLSTLVGITIDQGIISGVEAKVLDIFPELTFSNQDASKEALTLGHILAMSTGLGWVEEDATFVSLYRSLDWTKYVLDKPMVNQPGDTFTYCSGCSHILSAILEKESGISTIEFARKNLFEPLGIQDFDWETNPVGTAIGGWGLKISPRDMAKLGYLYLHNGQWGDKQVVSQGWIETATRTQAVTGENLNYGYQWWIYPKYGAYTALGLYGQAVFVIPNLDLIVVTTANIPDHEPIFRLIEKFVVPAVKE